jgi:rubrerythrin
MREPCDVCEYLTVTSMADQACPVCGWLNRPQHDPTPADSQAWAEARATFIEAERHLQQHTRQLRPASEVETPAPDVACECCGYRTLFSDAGQYAQLCTVCLWCDDPRGNPVGLEEAKANYARVGAVVEERTALARPARSYEQQGGR